MKQLSYSALVLLLFELPAARASTESASTGSASARTPIVPTDGPVTSTTGTFIYDPSGNVAAIGTNSYMYDPMSRVTTGSVDRFGNVQSQTYTYDLYGNRLSDGAVSYSVSTVTNQLTGSGAQYDGAGNLTQWQPPGSTAVRSYSYDALNTVMREKVTVSGTNKYVVHIYTAADERYWNYRDDGTGTVVMTYALRDLGGSVLREFVQTATSSSDSWTARDYVHRAGALLASYDHAGGNTRHYSLDHLGTPRLVTDQNHVKVAEHTYFPFGAEYTDSSPTDGRLRFTGHEERDADFLAETRGELDSMHARYYSPAVGRFISVDPVLDANTALHGPQGWNRYSYARNQPLAYVDPDGRLAVPWHFGITYVAARRNGMGFGRSVSLAFWAAMVDFRRGSQSRDAASTNMHAMGGYVGTVEQTRAEARAGTVASVKSSMARGDLSAAIHTVQDAPVPLHQDHTWPGSYAALGLRDALLHFVADLFPSWSTVTAATANSEALLTGASVEAIRLFSPDPLPPSTERQPVLMMPQQSVFWDVLRLGDNLNCYNGACF